MEDARPAGSEEDADPLVGTSLGAFRIVEPLGRGGMGAVYRAVDERLGRSVALKVLAKNALADSRGRSRLLREARAAAAVAHPNIAAIYEVGDAGGAVFLAMELVTGETLRALLSRGPPPVAEALRIARAIATGVAKAHEAGVVHRDLKPENVMVAPGGEVKVLDFGLAKPAVAPVAISAEADTISGTVLRFGEAALAPEPSGAMTRDGEIVGTPPYMSPEQARGAEVDVRTDVFALGAILYELLAGRRAFEGPTVPDVLAKVLLFEPEPPSRVRAGVPQRLDALVMRCLRKDPGARYADASELAAELGREIDGPRPRSRRGLVVSLLGLALAGVAAVVALSFAAAPGPHPGPRPSPAVEVPRRREPTRRQLTAFPPDVPLYSTSLSPDGRLVVYASGTQLHLRSVDSDDARAIQSDRRSMIADAAFFPDGLRLLVAERYSDTGGRLTAVRIRDGAQRVLSERACWRVAVSPDGRRLACAQGETVVVMDAGGGGARAVGGIGFRSSPVAWSPDGRYVAFAAVAPARIDAVRADGTGLRTLVSDPGLIQDTGDVNFAWLAGGRLIYALAAGAPDPPSSAIWELALDAEARPRGPPVVRSRFEGVAIGMLSASADGTRVAMLAARTQTDVFVADLAPDATTLLAPRRVTLDDRNDRISGWLPDSRTVLFISDRSGAYAPYRQAIDAADAERIPTEGGVITWPVSPDGRSILYFHFEPPDGSRPLFPTLRSAPLTGPPSRLLQRLRTGESPRPAGRPAPLSASLACSADGRCIVAEQIDGEVVVSEPAVAGGSPREILRFASPSEMLPGLAVGPGGARLAVARTTSIEVRSLAGGEPEVLAADPALAYQYVAFDPLGRGLYVTATHADRGGYRMILLDRGRRAHVLLQSETTWLAHPTPSPDGRHLAYCEKPFDSDLWLLDDF